MKQVYYTHNPERYENIFNMYEFNNENDNTYIFYNILSKVTIPSDLDNDVYDYYVVESEMPLTTLSYRLYKTQHLWWLIMAVNKLSNPVKLLAAGAVIKVIKVEYLDIIFNSIKNKS
jgi:hypothetical protein